MLQTLAFALFSFMRSHLGFLFLFTYFYFSMVNIYVFACSLRFVVFEFIHHSKYHYMINCDYRICGGFWYLSLVYWFLCFGFLFYGFLFLICYNSQVINLMCQSSCIFCCYCCDLDLAIFVHKLQDISEVRRPGY